MKTQQTRQRRVDLLTLLPWGGQKQIAIKLNISQSRVSSIINGKENQDSDVARNVIRVAERMAERNKK